MIDDDYEDNLEKQRIEVIRKMNLNKIFLGLQLLPDEDLRAVGILVMQEVKKRDENKRLSKTLSPKTKPRQKK